MSLSPYAPLPSPLANKGRRRRSPISLTPLIDVVFILLVFFMLASSFLDWRTIEMNAPARAGAGAAMEGALLVELRGDGLRLSGRPVSPEELEERVRERLGEKPDQRILVRPAPGIDLQQTVTVLDLLAGAGARDLSLVRAPGN